MVIRYMETMVYNVYKARLATQVVDELDGSMANKSRQQMWRRMNNVLAFRDFLLEFALHARSALVSDGQEPVHSSLIWARHHQPSASTTSAPLSLSTPQRVDYPSYNATESFRLMVRLQVTG